MIAEAEGKGPPPAEANKTESAAAYMSCNAQQVQSGAPTQPAASTTTEEEDESEDESDILEESPCGRWQKRREEVRSKEDR